MSSSEPMLSDFHPDLGDIRQEVLQGLAKRPKSLPSKLFYDEVGSRLFDRICQLEDYYPTRTELGIMTEDVDAMVDVVGPQCRLVELGSGSSIKTRILLEHLRELAVYMPIDISRDHLTATAHQLAVAFPRVPIRPVCADYTEPLPPLPVGGARTVVYFPGSTIGNFDGDDAVDFLRRVRGLAGDGGGLLIGVDLKKDVGVLERAYNDAEGVTAAFNLNVLARLNRELGAEFDLGAFRHHAFFDEKHSRIEMQLVSEKAQRVQVAGVEVMFEAGEVVTTEYSHRYSVAEFAEVAARAGFVVREVWTDADGLFSVQYCEVA